MNSHETLIFQGIVEIFITNKKRTEPHKCIEKKDNSAQLNKKSICKKRQFCTKNEGGDSVNGISFEFSKKELKKKTNSHILRKDRSDEPLKKRQFCTLEK